LDDWWWRAELVGRSLPAYTPDLSTLSSTRVLVHPVRAEARTIRNGHLVLGCTSSLDAFSSYHEARSCSACLVRQPMDQRRRRPVPFVLKTPYLQMAYTPTRYQPNCLTTF